MTITGLRRADHLGADDAILGSVGYARSGVDVAVLRDDGTPADSRRDRRDRLPRRRCDVGLLEQSRARRATRCRTAGYSPATWARSTTRGYLTLRDRSKDVVISGGSNIYPREVEEALLEHPGVSEAGVVGAPDAGVGRGRGRVHRRHRRPGRPGCRTCCERIARFKRPKRYEFVDALPKNSYGKVLKRELRARLV